MKNSMLIAFFVGMSVVGCGGADAKDPASGGDSKGYGYEFENEKVSPGMAAAPETKTSDKPMPGRLAPEEIQKVVRANFGAIRVCYEELLKTDPKAAGKISMKFEIKTDGMPDKVAKDSATITDEKMIQCVTKVFEGLKYPEPQGGIVTVIYPIEFSP